MRIGDRVVATDDGGHGVLSRFDEAGRPVVRLDDGDYVTGEDSAFQREDDWVCQRVYDALKPFAREVRVNNANGRYEVTVLADAVRADFNPASSEMVREQRLHPSKCQEAPGLTREAFDELVEKVVESNPQANLARQVINTVTEVNRNLDEEELEGFLNELQTDDGKTFTFEGRRFDEDFKPGDRYRHDGRVYQVVRVEPRRMEMVNDEGEYQVVTHLFIDEVEILDRRFTHLGKEYVVCNEADSCGYIGAREVVGSRRGPLKSFHESKVGFDEEARCKFVMPTDTGRTCDCGAAKCKDQTHASWCSTRKGGDR